MLNCSSAASKLPPGFIALSESDMNWSNAKAFCQQRGGKLPRVNNSDSWNGKGKATIDGFGAEGAPWPSGLPDDGLYRMGTACTAFSGCSLLVTSQSGKVFVTNTRQSNVYGRAVCVPK